MSDSIVMTALQGIMPVKGTTMQWTMGDISNPGTLKITEQVFGFYIGGNTPHIWTKLQVDAQPSPLRLPIWVYGHASGASAGTLEASAVLDLMPVYGVPKNMKVAVDMETMVDVDYINAFEHVLSRHGYGTAVYGSKDTITGNPLTNGGRWVADWTGTPHFSGVQGEFACQWQKGDGTGNSNPWDVSVVRSLSGIWNTEATEPQRGVLVEIPSGASRLVKSVNGGASWS